MKFLLRSCFILLLASCSSGSDTSNTDTPLGSNPPPQPVKRDYLWPLCGHITSAPPNSWQVEDGCPDNRWNEDHNDFPLSSTYGPRLKAGDNFRYDYHRGIDIPTPLNTPIFAVKEGLVTRAGAHASHSDLGVTIQHYDKDNINCNTQNCLHSLYIHMSQVVVAEDQEVTKGQLIGYSGAGSSGFPHLHFDIRQSPGEHDKTSAWRRDAIHPLSVLPHTETLDTYTLAIEQIQLFNNNDISLKAIIQSNSKNALVLKRIEIELFEVTQDGNLVAIEQKHSKEEGNTPEGVGYAVNPHWLDLQQLNRQYSYKDSSTYPWSSFTLGGAFQSPYASIMGDSYSPNIHLDKTTENDYQVGEFNGLLIKPEKFTSSSDNYQLEVSFTKLTGISDLNSLCVKARLIDVQDKATDWFEKQCPSS